jgi:hypothetical protein
MLLVDTTDTKVVGGGFIDLREKKRVSHLLHEALWGMRSVLLWPES